MRILTIAKKGALITGLPAKFVVAFVRERSKRCKAGAQRCVRYRIVDKLCGEQFERS